MRNYIILNGVNSNTITGLLISTLPPITKPKIRTQVEEIDGRDGDIVTKLGYSAYEKEFQIGLYGDFDIDEVIAYFNSEGTVVFSNEDDKYYNYQIVDQIDFEKLIKFKTASVKMHVQPFKYPLEETPVEITIQNITATGETMSLNNTADAPLEIDLKGNTSQDGTPTPEAPVEIETTTGGQEVDIVGKNVLKYPYYETTRTTGGVTFTDNGDGSITISNTATANAYFNIFPNTTGIRPKLPAGTYTFSNKELLPAGVTVTLSPRNSDGTAISGVSAIYLNNTTKEASRTINQDFEIMCNIFVSNGTALSTPITIYPILEVGSEATTFEPYKSQSYEINLGSVELCKIGDYKDRIYKSNGKWYIEKQIGKIVLNGADSENWNGGTIAGDYLYVYSNAYDNILLPNKSYLGISTYFKVLDQTINTYTPTITTDSMSLGSDSAVSGNRIRIKINQTTANTVATFETWLNTHNTSVYYVLDTPTTTEITDSELITQLEAINIARSYDPVTNISQNTANKPFILDAIAVQKGSDTGVVNNTGNIYSKPTLDIEGTGIAEIYLDGNQMFNVDLSTINECIIDTTNLETYDPATSQLMNRQVTGDYSNFKLNTGNNTIKVSGNVSKVTISDYTRWL